MMDDVGSVGCGWALCARAATVRYKAGFPYCCALHAPWVFRCDKHSRRARRRLAREAARREWIVKQMAAVERIPRLTEARDG